MIRIPTLFRLAVFGAALLTIGCQRMTEVGVISYYAYPVEVYDTTNLKATPRLLGIVGAGAILRTHVQNVQDDNLYRFTIRRVNGKIIKQITESGQTLNGHPALEIGR